MKKKGIGRISNRALAALIADCAMKSAIIAAALFCMRLLGTPIALCWGAGAAVWNRRIVGG